MTPEKVSSKTASQVGRVSQTDSCGSPLLTKRGIFWGQGWVCDGASKVPSYVSRSVVVGWKAEADPAFEDSWHASAMLVASKPMGDLTKGTGNFWTEFQLRGDLGVSYGALAVQSCSGRAERHPRKVYRQNKTIFSRWQMKFCSIAVFELWYPGPILDTVKCLFCICQKTHVVMQ